MLRNARLALVRGMNGTDMAANLLANRHATNVRVVTFGSQTAKTEQCTGTRLFI